MIFEAKLEHNSLPKDKDKSNHLLLRMKTPATMGKSVRKPLVIGLAIDKSWSMKGEKMEATINAACSLVNWLTRHDFLSVIAYSEDVQVVQQLIQLKEKVAVTDKIQSIKVGTSTNLSGGWLQALRSIESSDVKDAYKRVILLTDGNPTSGIKEPEQLVQIAADHQKKGITTTAVGFGEDFNEANLRDIAVAGGGNYYYIESPEQAPEIFLKEFGDVGALYAQATEIQLNLSPYVKVREVLGASSYDIQTTDYPANTELEVQKVIIQVGDIRADDIRNLVVDLEVLPAVDSFKGELMSVSMSYYNLMDNMKLETHESKLANNLTKSGSFDPDTKTEVLIAHAAKAMIDAAKYTKEKNPTLALEILNRMIDVIDKNTNLSPDILAPLTSRLKNLQSKIKENSADASKTLLSSGSDLYTRRADTVDTKDLKVHNDVFEYKVDGDLDLYATPELKNMIQEKMDKGYRFVIIDMGKASHIDSSVIGAFIQIVGWLRRRGGEFIVVNLKDNVKKIFQLTRLETHIRVAESMDMGRSIVKNVIAEL